ncbi:MAG: protease modulator HflC [Planctomycetales bacterium]
MVLLLVWLATSLFIVDETEDCIVERLGKIVAVYDQVAPERSDRGLHLKFPWPIETVRRFDRRLQVFDPPAREMFTSDRKNLTIGSFVTWKIAEEAKPSSDLLQRPVVKFYRSLGSVPAAEARIDTRIRSIVSSEIGSIELSKILSAQDSESPPQKANPIEELGEKILKLARQRPDESEPLQQRLGIELVDYGVKRLNLPEANLFAVYERMRKEREKIAQYYRSAGEAEKTVIESRARRRSEELIAQAQADAARTRGAGEARALEIRNKAYAADPELFQFLRTLETYRKVLNQKSTLILSASSPLFRMLTEGVPQSKSPKIPASSPVQPSPDKTGETKK